MSLLRPSSKFLRPFGQQASRGLSTSCSRAQNNYTGSPQSELLSALDTSAFGPRSSRTTLADSRSSSPSSLSSSGQPSSRSIDTMKSMLEMQRQRLRDVDARAEMERIQLRKDMEQQLTRRWKAGDVYAPHDLSGVEMQKWKTTRRAPTRDVFDALGVDPRTLYKNFSVMSEFMTEMGRIKRARETGLRRVNQRKLAKAIRRAIGIGIMPSVHKHPELLEARAREYMKRYGN